MFNNEVHEYELRYSVPELGIVNARIIIDARSTGKAEDSLINFLEKTHKKKVNPVILLIDDRGVKAAA